MNILGISAYYHDSAACLLQDARITAAAQEERFTRKKHDSSFPSLAVKYCLQAGGINTNDLDAVVFYDKPLLKFERLLQTYMQYAPKGLLSFLKAIPVWMKQKLWIKDMIARDLGYEGPIYFTEHHESHAASAFYPSPFDEAAVLTMDGVGEWATASFGTGRANKLTLDEEIIFPHSLGLLYSAFTYYAGFRVNSGEYKLMGLAPYGEPVYKDLILKHLIDLREDGSFRLDMQYFNYACGLTMTNGRFHKLFGGPPRKPESKLTQRDMDLARSIQEVTEEVVLRIGRYVHAKTGMKNLCLAGGVALNCVANGRLLREGPFERLWIQPAAGDAGGALGAALFGWHQIYDHPRTPETGQDRMSASFLGPSFSDEEIENFLVKENIPHTKLQGDNLIGRAADLIASEKVVGWFQGRMEFGPRALGNRSIIGDARSASMQETMNLKIKFRESFRPFAPAVLRERVQDFFELNTDSPYMLLVAPVHSNHLRNLDEAEKRRQGMERLYTLRSDIPAVTHVDNSARIQTVTPESNPLFYRLLKRFDEKHGSPVLINTSFNVRGEPLVCTPEDAYRCFRRTNMDALFLGSFLVEKKEGDLPEKDKRWMKEFELD